MKILAIDISGNYEEGKGTTGYCIGNADGTIIELGEIKAADYPSRMDYHNAVISLALNNSKSDIIVCENFRLYQHKAQAQVHSQLETPRIIGALEYCAWVERKPIYFQMASDVKKRFSDDIMLEKKIIQKHKNAYYFNFIKTNDHMRDAMRHLYYFVRYRLKKEG